MATTLTYLTTTVTLPDSLQWQDEFSWSAVQTTSGYGVAGALFLDSGLKLAGRPITLSGGTAPGVAWGEMQRSVLLTLYGWAAITDAQMTLLYRATSYAVKWDCTQVPVQATPLADYADPLDTDLYVPTLRLIKV